MEKDIPSSSPISITKITKEAKKGFFPTTTSFRPSQIIPLMPEQLVPPVVGQKPTFAQLAGLMKSQKSTLVSTTEALEASQAELAKTNAALEGSQEELAQTKAALEASQAKLASTNAALEGSKEALQEQLINERTIFDTYLAQAGTANATLQAQLDEATLKINANIADCVLLQEGNALLFEENNRQMLAFAKTITALQNEITLLKSQKEQLQLANCTHLHNISVATSQQEQSKIKHETETNQLIMMTTLAITEKTAQCDKQVAILKQKYEIAISELQQQLDSAKTANTQGLEELLSLCGDL